MINGTIQKKLQTLDIVLLELKSLGKVTTIQLEQEWRTRRAVERDLQVLVEIMIDVCQRLIALAGQTPAETARDAIDRCILLSALSPSEDYRRMVQFRNYVVHHYDKIEPAILVDIVNRRLGDFERSGMRFRAMLTVNWQAASPIFATHAKVVAAWAFGSAQAGTVRPGGDLDIAVLVRAKLSFEELTDLIGDLQAAFHFENIDLVPLDNDSSPILRFEAVSGRLLYCQDAAYRAAFVSLAAREYEESMAMIKRTLADRQRQVSQVTPLPAMNSA